MSHGMLPKKEARRPQGFGTEPEPQSQHPVYESNSERNNESIFIAVP